MNAWSHRLCIAIGALLAFVHVTDDARAQSPRQLVFGTSETVPYGTLLDLLGILPGISTTVTVSATPGSGYSSSANLTGDGRLTCQAGNGVVTFAAGQGAATATCHARVCTVTLGLITICNDTSFPLRAVACQAGNGRVDTGCSADVPACDISGEPQCVGCTEDLHCGARGPISVAVGQVVRVADDLLRQLLGVSLTAILTDVTVSATVNGPFGNDAVLDTDLACRVNASGQVEVVAGAHADGTATCHVRACVLGLLCTEVPLDILVDLCLVGGTCNPVATCDTTRHECVACRDDRGPGQIDSGCSSALPSCQVDQGVARCTECDSDDDCSAGLLSTLLGPEQQVTVALARVLEFLRLSTNVLPSSLSVSAQVDGPFGDEALLGTDLQVASCGVTVDGDIRISANHVDAAVTCYVRVCAALLGDAITTCVTAPLDIQVDACVLRNDCDKEPICLADATCATCADTAPAGRVDRGCDGDTPACAGGSCVECLADADCNPRYPLIDLDLGQSGLVSRDLLLASANVALDLLVDTLEVGATVQGPFGPGALVDIGAEVAACHVDLDGNLHVLAPDAVYGQATCHVRACAVVATVTTCVVIPVEINVDPCATRGDCRPPICADQHCQACADDGPGVTDRGCGPAAPACLQASGICVECTDDADCGGGVCDRDSHRCVACVDTGEGVDHGCNPGAPVCHPGPTGPGCEPCVDDTVGATDTGCTDTQPACETEGGTCEECTVDADCDTGDVCSPDHRCVPCVDTAAHTTIDHGCTTTAPLCVASPDRCEPCIDDQDGAPDTGCTAVLPACIENPTGHRCGECDTDADCPGQLLCDPTHQCVPCVDGRGDCTQPNRPPIGLDDHVTTPEDIAVLIVVSANDIDPEGHVFAPRSIAVPPRNGTAILFTDGTVLYTPQPDFWGTDVFTYQTCDILDACSVAHVWIEILPVNDPPDVFDDYAQTTTDTAVTTNVLANDIDRDGDVLVVQSIAITQGAGLASFTIDGQVVYVPAPADMGQMATVGYVACDPSGACESATLTIGVDAGEMPEMPGINDDFATTRKGVAVAIDVLANDRAPAGTELSVVSWSVGQGGAVWLEDGMVHYAPRLGWVGEDRVRYTACTNDGRCAAAWIVIVVEPGDNLPPLATSDDITTIVDTPITFDPTANDIDPEGEVVVLVSVFPPQHGTATITDGLVTYTPNPGFVGEDRFGVTVADGEGLTADSGVRIRVLPGPNLAPVALNDDISLEPGADGLIDVLANDFDPDGDLLQFVSIEQPPSGLVTIYETGDILHVRMNASFIGTEHFTYRITDGRGGYAAASVMVVVHPFNELPVAQPDFAEVDEDDQTVVDVLANDYDPEGDPLILSGLSRLPRFGVAEIVGRAVRYTPAPDYFGEDGFTYRVCDLRGGCSEGIATMTVRPVNDAPVANDDTVVVRIGSESLLAVLANDHDIDGDVLTLRSIVVAPTAGTAILAGDHVLFAAPGTPTNVTFRYEVCDASECAQATVQVTVTDGPVGRPIAVDDTATTYAGRTVTLDVLANDHHETPGATLHIGEFTQPANGTVELSAQRLVYRPAVGFVGRATFTYEACDVTETCDEAAVTIVVTPVPGNRPPVANDDTFLVFPGSTTTLDVLGNDTDPDGDTLVVTSVTAFSASVLGRVELDRGVVRFIATTTSGDGTFAYTVCDASTCATATVTVSVAIPPEQFEVTGGAGCQGGTGGLWLALLGLLMARRYARR